MNTESEEGLSMTIEGLIEAGVLIETQSCCDTPLLPVLKADGKKWRLVHDLRAINDIAQNWLVEVPNPHTLLTNVPPDAKYLIVIDLCGAFFLCAPGGGVQTSVCVYVQRKTVNIYTDSAYAHEVCHLFGAVWKQRGFKKSDGTPIQHH